VVVNGALVLGLLTVYSLAGALAGVGYVAVPGKTLRRGLAGVLTVVLAIATWFWVAFCLGWDA
jgi:hypothetical protein